MQILKESLKKAENAAKIPAPQVQIDHALDYIKRARKRLESADDKIAKATQALHFAEEEKELDMKGIAESEALIKRLREEVEQNLHAGPSGDGQTETSAQFQGDAPPPRWAQELVELRQQVAQLREEDRTVNLAQDHDLEMRLRGQVVQMQVDSTLVERPRV